MTNLSSSARTALPWAVVVGIILIALNLRGPIVAPAPVLGLIQTDLGLSGATAGLITGLPVLCFALATPFASRLIRRAGPEIAVIVCLLGVLAGTIIRSAGPTATVFAGTVVIGASIMIGNIVVPVIIRRDVPWQHASTATGIYTAGMNVGSMITSLGTAPLAAALGWRWALATWGLFAIAGAAFWRTRLRHRPAAVADAAVESDDASVANASRRVRRIGLLLMAAFAGQSFAYYAATAWLPTLLADTRGLDAAASGGIASLFQISAVVGALGVPILAARLPAWVPVALMGLCWFALPIGLYVAPEHFVIWAILGGVGQGGAFTAILAIIARVTRSDREAAKVSASVQLGGYIAATFGAPILGWLNSTTGGWTAPLAVVLLATIVYTVTALIAAVLARRPSEPATQ